MNEIISDNLSTARNFETELDNKELDRPLFHLTPIVGWMNDPNGFSLFKDKVHLFFQYHPYSTKWGPMHWGHVVTDDFVTWKYLPTALAPDTDYDNFGCFSGTAIEFEDKHILAYTSVKTITEENGNKKEIQNQSICIGDGLNYEKCKFNPVLTEDDLPEGSNKYDFRDPKIWIEDDVFYMAVASRNIDGSGQILIYNSTDLKNWDFVSTIDRCRNRFGKMWECPDLFHLDDCDYLLTSPQEMKSSKPNMYDGFGTIYISGKMNKSDYSFEEKIIESIDLGFDFYAPQTLLNRDGRRIMIAWMQSWENPLFSSSDGFCGMMSFPRELHSKNGRLLQTPVKEIERYYIESTSIHEQKVPDTLTRYDALSSRLMDITFDIKHEGSCSFELRVAADETVFTSIVYSSEDSTVTFDRTKSGLNQTEHNCRTIQLPKLDSRFNLRLLMDKYSIELFINDGEFASTNIIRTPMEIDGIYMKGEGNIEVDIEQHLLGNFKTCPEI
jgi:beta-fructofuranosidase